MGPVPLGDAGGVVAHSRWSGGRGTSSPDPGRRAAERKRPDVRAARNLRLGREPAGQQRDLGVDRGAVEGGGVAAEVRHRADQGAPDPGMTRRTRALLLGLAVAGAYITGAAATARLSILGRAPLLDGFTAPPPYRWVSPPPALASTHLQPASGRFTINIDPQSGSEANVWTTHDAQVSVALGQGAIPPSGHADAILRITPLAPD